MSRPSLQSRPSSVAAAKKNVILVSGGNTGIGYEIVKRLAEDNPNNQILLGCRDTHKGEEAVAGMGAPGNVNPIQLDITDDDSVEHCYMAIEQHFGKLDILVNNAGTAAQHLPKEATLRQKFDLCFSVNVTSTAVLTEKMAPLLDKSQLPKVIFVSSTLASMQKTLEFPKVPPLPYYSASKTGDNALTVYYARQHPKWKVNAVCPGYLATGLNGETLTDELHPKHGAVRISQLVAEGADGVTGTYSNSAGPIPW